MARIQIGFLAICALGLAVAPASGASADPASPAPGTVVTETAPAPPLSPRELADPRRPLRLRLPPSDDPREIEARRVLDARRRLADMRERLARGSKPICREWSSNRTGSGRIEAGLLAATPAPWAGPYASVRVFPSWVPDPETWLRVQEQLLVSAGCICPEGSPSPGSVPDGSAVPGFPLTVKKNILVPTDLELAWDPSCNILATDYSVHEGVIGSWYSHTSLACSTGGSISATVTPSTGSRYYLVVPMVPTAEGSYGTDSSGAERPVSTIACRAARIIAPCP